MTLPHILSNSPEPKRPIAGLIRWAPPDEPGTIIEARYRNVPQMALDLLRNGAVIVHAELDPNNAWEPCDDCGEDLARNDPHQSWCAYQEEVTR